MEQFKNIGNAGFEHLYLVSDFGRVYSNRARRFLNPSATKKGYMTVKLIDNPLSKTVYVHRLVAFAFLKNPCLLPQINHKDSDKRNNHVSNLEWCNNSHNMRHNWMTRIKQRMFS